MIDAAIENRIRALMFESLVAEATPTLHAMAGIPGAGKSTFVARGMASGMLPAHAFVLNPDRVMNELPAYHDDRLSLGREAAFARWEIPCRTLAYQLGREAAALRFPIIKDMGLVRPENWDMLEAFKGLGYKIVLYYIECTVHEAVRRCALRDRHFPAEQISARAQTLSTLMASRGMVADIIRSFDNNDLDNPFLELPLEGLKKNKGQ